MQELANTIFLNLFLLLYSIIHTQFTSYIIILMLSLFILKKFYGFTKKVKKPKNFIEIISFILMYGFLFFVASFNIWFVLIHFHTYRILEKV